MHLPLAADVLLGVKGKAIPVWQRVLLICTLWMICALFLSPTLWAQVPKESPLYPQVASGSPAKESTAPAEQPEILLDQQPNAGRVVIDGRTIITIHRNVGSFTPEQRANAITDRILRVAKEGVKADSVVVAQLPMWTTIDAGGQTLLAISDEDAQAVGRSRAELAAEEADSIRQALITYHREHSLRSILRGVFYSLLVTTALIPIFLAVRKLRLIVRLRLEKWIEDRKNDEGRRTPLHILTTYLASMLLVAGTVFRWLVLLGLLEVYITLLLSFFPQTRAVSHEVTGWIVAAVQSLGRSALNYVPNLFIVALIVFIAVQLSRVITMVFSEIEKGALKIRNFYPEWAEPTAKLVRVMVMALMIVVIFPYLPGSKSPAFQGISIFVGVLLSLGSSSAVANAIAGIILTYMRSFSIGDWVKVGDTIGEVVERNILVTRILTPKQETITIPNATVMSGSVMNFTREAKNAGVIFHTTVTIGYEAPWKTVHSLLIDAALATEHVLRNPPPFVLQTALNDFYVTYELNAHTDYPRRMQHIYSDLHQNIQDRFNEAGVEICSPHFASLRDGNTLAIPTQYMSRDYVAPTFHVDTQEKGAVHTGGR